MAPAGDFVEQCRREWRRLGVPESLAEEMATDLACDLEEAEAEGVSAEELLGSSVVDPRSFAASWATERGVAAAPPGRGDAGRRPFVLVGFTGLAAITLVVAALLLLTGQPKVALARSGAPSARLPSPAAAFAPGRHVLPGNVAAPVEWILLFLAIVAVGFAAWLWSGWGRSRPPAAPA
jgi:hypothetical protein